MSDPESKPRDSGGKCDQPKKERKHKIRQTAAAPAGIIYCREPLFTAAIVLLLAAAAPRPACAGDGITFIVTSDAHYDAFENEDRNGRNRSTLEEMNRIAGAAWPGQLGGGPIGKPLGVIALGDLIDDGDRKMNEKSQSAEQWKLYAADFGLDGTEGLLKYPVYDSWGNHDGPPAGREKHGFSFQAELRRRNALRKEKSLIASLSENGLHYSWDWGPVHFVQLNLYPGDRPHPKTHYSPQYHDPQGSLSFLKKDLAAHVGASGRPVVLLHHYDLQGTDWWHEEERRAYYDAVRDYNVVAVLHGHTGTGTYSWKPEGAEKALDVINTGQTEKGFFVVEIAPRRFRSAYRVKEMKGQRWDGSWTWAHFLDRPLGPPAPIARPRGLTRPLQDKTLVAWVCLDGLAQRGGSALTLMEGEDFDAVVLGERVERRWMAGSDFFRRTQSAEGQSASPPEDSAPDQLVQVAISYAGDRVTLHRNGKPYADYRIEKARAFGPDAFVLVGLRYLASMGAIGFLRGAVEEVRIYDVALDAGAIASLEPGKPSVPEPLACWTFEDGSAADARGTFPPGELAGGARIEGGRLHLDGAGAYMVSRVPEEEGGPMFYAPRRSDTGRMWDTWLYWRDGTYHLFYLAASAGSWDNVSMAASEDGVRWKEIGPILRKAEGVTWMGTGSTWRSPRFEEDGKFFLNFSEWRGDRQTIFFAESRDLLRWTRLPGDLEFRQDVRWYEPKGRWDCIYAIPREGGGLWGYWTADPAGRPGVGFGQSSDGVRWEALEPPHFLEGAPHGEAGAVEKIGGRYHLLLGSGGNMLALVGERPQGPFRPAGKNAVLLHAGPTYFARFFPTSPGGVLVNHHAIAKDGRVHLGLLKSAVVDAEGTLRLGWWKGNEKLKQSALEVKAPAAGAGALAFLENELPAGEGIVLEGTVALPGGAGEAPRGLFIETVGGAGTAIRIGAGGVAEFGPLAGDGTGFRPEMRVDRQMAFGGIARLRLCLKRRLLEIYLDDMHLECYSLPARVTGRIGLFGPPGAFRDLKAWR